MDDIRINSNFELNERRIFLKNKSIILKHLFNLQLNKYEMAYLIYNIYVGLNLYNIDTEHIKWSIYSNYMDKQYYENNISLTDGQNKLLLISLLQTDNDINYDIIFNIYQLGYLEYVFNNEEFNMNFYNIYFNPYINITYEGIKISSLRKKYNALLNKNLDNEYIFKYFIVSLNKLYNYKKNKDQSKDIDQFKQLLNLLIKNINVKQKMKIFIDILHDKQILKIGYV